jgi:4-diphosphocytidyl-2-C-methyl-D-erythritol kinase
MRVARVRAQAKVNVGLMVGDVDHTGYHPVHTLLHRIDLADEVVVRVGGSGRSLECDGPYLPNDGLGPVEMNLAYRAAVAYAERTGWPRGFSIELTKNIPVGGGLGGGSADAGAVLRVLNAMAPQPQVAEALQEMARPLGADVPFLTSELVAAIGTGRGDRLQDMPRYKAREVLVVVPSFRISTADAYRWLDEDRPNVFLEASGELSAAGNDFEPVIEKRYPKLREYRERLSSLGATTARLAGSGSCVFGIFDRAAPDPRELAIDAAVIPTRTSERVVQVEVLE